MTLDGKNKELWICGGTALTMNSDGGVIEDSVIQIKEGRIVTLEGGKDYKIPNGVKVVDANSCLVLPGLVNAHTHSAFALFRGIADDLPLREWLNDRIFPLEKKWTNPDFTYLGTMLACSEMIRTGTTTFNDMYYFEDLVAKASQEAGLRSVCGQTIIEAHVDCSADDIFGKVDQLREAVENYPLVSASIAPHAIYSLSRNALEKVIEYAKKYDMRVQIHVSEFQGEVDDNQKNYGRSPVQYLNALGLWDRKVTAAHCVCLTDKDIEILGEHHVGISHNIESNLKVGTGIAPVVELRKAGAHVAIGTDSVASNNNLDLLQEVDTTLKLQTYRKGPGSLKAKEALEMLTIEGARALYLDDKIGSLEVGKQADIIAVDINKTHLAPMYDPYSLLAYSASGADVKHSIVSGQVLMENYQLKTLDEKSLLKEAHAFGKRIAATL